MLQKFLKLDILTTVNINSAVIISSVRVQKMKAESMLLKCLVLRITAALFLLLKLFLFDIHRISNLTLNLIKHYRKTHQFCL